MIIQLPHDIVVFVRSVSTAVDSRCSLPLIQGTCRDYTIYWYYDKQANSCAQFWYGGCGGNENRYQTEEECKNACVASWTGKWGRCPSASQPSFRGGFLSLINLDFDLTCLFFSFLSWISYEEPCCVTHSARDPSGTRQNEVDFQCVSCDLFGDCTDVSSENSLIHKKTYLIGKLYWVNYIWSSQIWYYKLSVQDYFLSWSAICILPQTNVPHH